MVSCEGPHRRLEILICVDLAQRLLLLGGQRLLRLLLLLNRLLLNGLLLHGLSLLSLLLCCLRRVLLRSLRRRGGSGLLELPERHVALAHLTPTAHDGCTTNIKQAQEANRNE